VKHGYIHRDIKPENALVHSNTFKVADFGFATKCDIHGRQLMKDCVGTPLYMAPQLLERGPYTAKSDIWSIGVLTYEMLYGRQPWPCRDLNSYVLNMKNMSLRFPFEKPVSEEMKDFIRKALTVDEA
jgi:calcium-dependent protein kinase